MEIDQRLSGRQSGASQTRVKAPFLVAAVALASLTWFAYTSRGQDPRDRRQATIDAPELEMLKDAHICPGFDGVYYLTGTAGTYDKSGRIDFDFNRGAPLWRSKDVKTWECLGYAWDRVEHFERTGGRPKLGVWLDWSAPADRIDGFLSQATTTPELHQIAGDWYLVCAMNGQNIIVQKSTTTEPNGPYEDHAYLATRGGNPTLFVDEDGCVYLVFADAWIARLDKELATLAEDPRPMLPKQVGPPGAGRLTLGEPGVSLLKHQGRYYVLAARWTVRGGKPSHDAFVWTSENVYGPYRETGDVITAVGCVSVFRDHQGRWRAVSSRPCTAGPQIHDVPLP